MPHGGYIINKVIILPTNVPSIQQKENTVGTVTPDSKTSHFSKERKH